MIDELGAAQIRSLGRGTYDLSLPFIEFQVAFNRLRRARLLLCSVTFTVGQSAAGSQHPRRVMVLDGRFLMCFQVLVVAHDLYWDVPDRHRGVGMFICAVAGDVSSQAAPIARAFFDTSANRFSSSPI
jgi:hypothetical protein